MIPQKQKYMTRTVQVILDVNDHTLQRIKDTRDAYADIFNAHAQWSKNNRSASSKAAHEKLYKQMRDDHPHLPSAMIQCARNHALGAMKSYNSNNPKKKWCKDISYTASSMRYDRRTVSLNSSGTLTFSLHGGKRGKANVELPKFFTDRYGDWEFNSATIGVDRNGKPFANLSYRKVVTQKKIGGKIVGIDRGIYNVASTSEGENFSSKKIRGRKRQLQHNISTLQAKVASGSRSAKRRLKAQRGKNARFSKNELDKITKQLANADDVSTYVLEDLTGLYQQRRSKNFNRLKSTWSPSLFEFMLSYKCEEKGIEIVKVDPRYTSQTCSSCGQVEKKNRKGSMYKCCHCGYVRHADINAAINIRDKYVSTLPATSSVVQGVSQSPDDALTCLSN